MSYRVHIEHLFHRDQLGIHIGRESPTYGFAVVKPIEFVLEAVPEPISTPPALHIDRDLARALYDALGHVLGIHTPDARLAAETLELEQRRVDKLLDNVIKLTGGA